jgi:hypothetical protein
MSEGLKKMGEKFRSKREEMNLTLKEVENATSALRTINSIKNFPKRSVFLQKSKILPMELVRSK